MGSLLDGNPAPVEPIADAPVEPIETPTPPVDITFPENWKESLDEDFRNDPSMAAINDIQGLAKSYVNAQRMIGSDKFVVPGKHDDGTQFREAMVKMGLPQDVADYKVAGVEGADADLFTSFTAKAHELGIMPNQAEAIFGHIYADYTKGQEDLVSVHNNELLADQDALKKDWGQGFEANIYTANKAVNFLADGDEAMRDHLVNLGNDPKTVRMLHKIGGMLQEDNHISAPTGKWGKTPGEAQSEYESIMGNPKHPYNNGSHPAHSAAVAEVSKLFEMM